MNEPGRVRMIESSEHIESPIPKRYGVGFFWVIQLYHLFITVFLLLLIEGFSHEASEIGFRKSFIPLINCFATLPMLAYIYAFFEVKTIKSVKIDSNKYLLIYFVTLIVICVSLVAAYGIAVSNVIQDSRIIESFVLGSVLSTMTSCSLIIMLSKK